MELWHKIGVFISTEESKNRSAWGAEGADESLVLRGDVAH
jgi:hypothetical protein